MWMDVRALGGLRHWSDFVATRKPYDQAEPMIAIG
jgi:hypothetical protein